MPYLNTLRYIILNILRYCVSIHNGLIFGSFLYLITYGFFYHSCSIDPKPFQAHSLLRILRLILQFSYVQQMKLTRFVWWLMPRTQDPEVGGLSPTRVKPCCVLEQGTFTPQKVLVIPRKRWLRPNMTEKLFTWTLRINQPTRFVC